MYLSAVGTGRNERFAISCQDFIILAKASKIQQLGKGALNHPAPFHHLKPLAFSLDYFQLDFVQIAAQAATGRSNMHKRSSISFGNCTNSASGAEFTKNLARQIWRRTSSIQSEKVGCCFLYHAVV